MYVTCGDHKYIWNTYIPVFLFLSEVFSLVWSRHLWSYQNVKYYISAHQSLAFNIFFYHLRWNVITVVGLFIYVANTANRVWSNPTQSPDEADYLFVKLSVKLLIINVCLFVCFCLFSQRSYIFKIWNQVFRCFNIKILISAAGLVQVMLIFLKLVQSICDHQCFTKCNLHLQSWFHV